MIRGTHNEGISSQSKTKYSTLTRIKTGIVGEGIELVLAGATEGAAVIAEKTDTQDKAAFQTAFTSEPFNGTYE